jgi:hypothetical protein
MIVNRAVVVRMVLSPEGTQILILTHGRPKLYTCLGLRRENALAVGRFPEREEFFVETHVELRVMMEIRPGVDSFLGRIPSLS